MSTLAIDFGTSRIKAAVWDGDRQEPVALPIGWDGKPFCPAVFYVDSKGRIFVGDEAEAMTRIDPLGGIANLRYKLGSEWQFLPNGKRVETAGLLSAMFGAVIGNASQRFEKNSLEDCHFEHLIVALPPDSDDCADLYRESISNAGYTGQVVFIGEAEAAVLEWASQYGASVGDTALIVDVGGESTTFSYRTLTGPRRSRGCLGYPNGCEIRIGGNSIDQALQDVFFRKISSDQPNFPANVRLAPENFRHARESFSGVGMTGMSIDGDIRPVGIDDTEFLERQTLADAVMEVFGKSFSQNLEKMLAGFRYGSASEEKKISVVLTGGTSASNEIRKLAKGIVDTVSTDVKIPLECLCNPGFSVVCGATRIVPDTASEPWRNLTVEKLDLSALADWLNSCLPSFIADATHLSCRVIRGSNENCKTFCWFTYSAGEKIASNRAKGAAFSSECIGSDLRALLKDGEAAIPLSSLRNLKSS